MIRKLFLTAAFLLLLPVCEAFATVGTVNAKNEIFLKNTDANKKTFVRLNIRTDAKVINAPHLEKRNLKKTRYNSVFINNSKLFNGQEFLYTKEKKIVGYNLVLKYDKSAVENYEYFKALYDKYQRDAAIASVAQSAVLNDFYAKVLKSSVPVPKSRSFDDGASCFDNEKQLELDVLFSVSPFKDDKFNLDFGIGEATSFDKDPLRDRFVFSTGLSF